MLKHNRIYLGDCLEVMQDIDDASIDMILCDLPYGITACKWDSVIDLKKLWKHYRRIIKSNGAIVLTAAQPFTSRLGMSNIEWLRYSWVWKKSRVVNFLNAKKMPLKNHEDVLVFYARQPVYIPQNIKVCNRVVSRSGKQLCYGSSGRRNIQTVTDYPRSIQYFANDYYCAITTQKPVALFTYLIKTYSNEGDVVLDNCAGSGTTGIACQNTKRNFILIEKDVEHFRLARHRLIENRMRQLMMYDYIGAV